MNERVKTLKYYSMVIKVFQNLPNILCMLLLLLSHFSPVRLCATPQTAAHKAAPSLGFSRQEYWSGMPLPSLGRFLRYTKYGLRTRQTKMIGQRKPRSNPDYHEGATLSLSPPVCLPTHSILFPPNKYFTCLTIFHLCGNSFLKT